MKKKVIYLLLISIFFSFALYANETNEKNLPLNYSQNFERLPKKNIKIPTEKPSSSFNYFKFGSHTILAPTIGIGRRIHFQKFALDISINDAFVPYVEFPKEYVNASSIKVGFINYKNKQIPSWYKGIALEGVALLYDAGWFEGYFIYPNIELFFGKEYFSKNGTGNRRFFQVGVNLLPLVADYYLLMDAFPLLITMSCASISYGIAF